MTTYTLWVKNFPAVQGARAPAATYLGQVKAADKHDAIRQWQRRHGSVGCVLTARVKYWS